MTKVRVAAGMILGVLFLAGEAGAQAAAESPWSIGAGIGFTAGPGTFLLDGDVAHDLGEGMSLGPRMQLGFSDDEILLATTANFRYVFDLQLSPENSMRELIPFLQAGIGLGYVRKDKGPGHTDDTGFLFNIGAGVEWSLGATTLGSNMMFNILPSDTAGENFFFSWQLITLRFGI